MVGVVGFDLHPILGYQLAPGVKEQRPYALGAEVDGEEMVSGGHNHIIHGSGNVFLVLSYEF
jgi:hypothetical protein